MQSPSLQKCAVQGLIVLALGAVPQVLAHTTIQSQVPEGTTTYNNIVIGHGCTLADGSKLPVIAQSVVFPTVNPVATFSTGKMAGSADVFAITTFANIPQLIQSKDIFSKQEEKVDASGRVIGFASSEGSLSPNLHGLVPFRTGGISFNAASCIKKLLVKVAIADICQKKGAANLWIPALTPKYTDPKVDGIGSPATLIFNRDLTKNPFLAASNCGEGYEITLTPSAEDIDANLPLPGYLD